jgi:hypothetical protein
VLCSVTVPGERALLIEAEILEWWRGELALPAYLGPQEMKQGGWTETVSAEDIDLALTIRRIRHLTVLPACTGPRRNQSRLGPIQGAIDASLRR